LRLHSIWVALFAAKALFFTRVIDDPILDAGESQIVIFRADS
jgi:hypothetical protein